LTLPFQSGSKTPSKENVLGVVFTSVAWDHFCCCRWDDELRQIYWCDL